MTPGLKHPADMSVSHPGLVRCRSDFLGASLQSGAVAQCLWRVWSALSFSLSPLAATKKITKRNTTCEGVSRSYRKVYSQVPSSGPPTRLSSQSVDARCHQSRLLISLVGKSSDLSVVVGLSIRCKDISRAIAIEQLCRYL